MVDTLDTKIPHLFLGKENISTEASVYEQLYRKLGEKRVSHLTSPNVVPETEWDIPKQSIFHFLPRNDEEYGPPSTHLFLHGWDKLTYVYHVTKLNYLIGNPKHKLFNSKLAIKAFHRIEPTLKWCRNEEMFTTLSKTAGRMLIVNYAMMEKEWTYRELPFTPLHKWENKHKTLWENISHFLTISDRHHFIPLEIPTSIPNKMMFDKATKEMKRAYLDTFNTPEHLSLLDLWKWLNPETRNKSHMGILNTQQYYRVDFFINVGGNVCLLNLGKLNEWTTGLSEDELLDTEEEGLDETTVYSRVQRMFLKFLSTLNKMRDVNNVIKIATVTDNEGHTVQYYIDNNIELDYKEDDEEQPESTSSSVSDELTPDKTYKIENDDGKLKITQSEIPSVARREFIQRKEALLNHITNTQKELESDLEKELEKSNKDKITIKINLNKDKTESSKSDKIKIEIKRGKQDVSSRLIAGVTNNVNELVKFGVLDNGEGRYYERGGMKFTELKDPYGSNKTLMDIIEEDIPEAEEVPITNIPDNPFVIDKTMLKTSIVEFDKKYIKHVLNRDKVRNVLSIQKAGIGVLDYRIEKNVDVGNTFEHHVVQVQPVGGGMSTIRIKVPIIDENGTFKSAGTTYRLRKMRADKVIRKVGDNRASLTTYYGKLFFKRSDKGKYNYDRWLNSQLDLGIIEGKYVDVGYGRNSYPTFNLPRELIILSKRYSKLTIKESGVTLDLSDIKDLGGNKFKIGENVILNRETNQVEYDGKIRDLSEVLDLDIKNEPIEYVETKVLGERLPVGMILARHFGITKLLKLLDVKVDKYPYGRIQLTEHQYALTFSDEIWVFDKRDKISQMVLAGLLPYSKYFKHYSVLSLDSKDTYGAILSEAGLGPRYEIECDLMSQMFIDDISYQLLQRQNEPVVFELLLIRICELLLKGEIPNEINMDDMLIKGYERVAGAIYREMVKNVRNFKLKPITSRRRFEIHPNDVWNAIQSDTCDVVDEINPYKTIKEKENVTFNGLGGRTERSMVKATRQYDKSDLGVISEASVDNKSVAVNVFTSANPQFTDVYGNTKRLDNYEPTSILSTVALSKPFSDTDDMKRVLFSGTQIDHAITIKGLFPNPVRTGYEYVIPYKLDGQFVFVAKHDGVVKSIDTYANNSEIKVVTVKYLNGEEVEIDCSVKYVVSKGYTYRHEYVCDYEVGSSFKKDDVIVFNSNYFLRDILNPGRVVCCNTTLGTTALVDYLETLEDGSAVSEKFNEIIKTEVVEKRCIIVEKENEIKHLVKIGDILDPDDILCTIEDPTLAKNSHVLNDEISETLKRLNKNSPRAKVKGKVNKIETVYFCDIDETSQSLRKIIESSNKQLQFTEGSRKDGIMTNQVTEPTTVAGEKLSSGQVAIVFYITYSNGANGGDKIVLSNQLKTTISRRLTGVNETESGTPIDVWFGYASISDRIVQSAELMGICGRLLTHLSKKVVEAYDS